MRTISLRNALILGAVIASGAIGATSFVTHSMWVREGYVASAKDLAGPCVIALEIYKRIPNATIGFEASIFQSN